MTEGSTRPFRHFAYRHEAKRVRLGALVDREKLRQIDWHLHDLRHEGARGLLADGVDIRIVQMARTLRTDDGLAKNGVVRDYHWTTITPFSMFMPHANATSPVLAGVKSIATGSLSGSARLMFRDENTTSVAHVLSVVRTKVRRAGKPARRLTLSGSNPFSVTKIFAVWMFDEPAWPDAVCAAAGSD
jgi:hypothetical protein